MNPEKIGPFIRQLRQNRCMTQEELAKKLVVDRATVSKWERNVYIPSQEILLKLSEIFNVSVYDIMLGEKQNNSNTEIINNFVNGTLKKYHKVKKILLVCGLLSILLFIFSIYSYINTNKSIKIYDIIGNNNQFIIDNGFLIMTKEKFYIQIGNIESLNNNDISELRLYYKKNGKDYTIFSDTVINDLLIKSFPYNENLSYSDFKYIKNNLFLEITSNDEKSIITFGELKNFSDKK